MAFLNFSKLILCLIFLFIKSESKFFGIESLDSDNYFVVLDNGIYLYSNNFFDN